ncbi:argininosuccinate synthase domain-containing protein [Candidatus Vidania fulgoroideorum]
MKIIKKIKNKKIALAYSGGLDTSFSIKWLKKKKAKVYAFYVDLGNHTKKQIKNIKKESLNLGAVRFKSINCKKKIIKEAFLALKTRAFNVYCGTGIYFNITPIGRVIISNAIYKELENYKINIWSDGSTYKGNDIERFFNYIESKNSKIVFYKPWLNKSFVKLIKGRKKMEKILKKKSKYSVDSNVIGNTYEGNKIENLNFNITKMNFILCNLKYNKKKTILKLKIKNGNVIKYNNIKKNIFYIINKICSKHNLGISDQIEDRIIGTKSRGIYESPAMFLFYNVYDRMISCLYNYDDIIFYRNNGIRLGKLLYFGRWYCKEAKIRKKVGIYYASKINGKIKIAIIYNNLFFLNTYVKKNKYKKKNSTMEGVYKENFSYIDRIGHLKISKINLDI